MSEIFVNLRHEWRSFSFGIVTLFYCIVDKRLTTRTTQGIRLFGHQSFVRPLPLKRHLALRSRVALAILQNMRQTLFITSTKSSRIARLECVCDVNASCGGQFCSTTKSVQLHFWMLRTRYASLPPLPRMMQKKKHLSLRSGCQTSVVRSQPAWKLGFRLFGLRAFVLLSPCDHISRRDIFSVSTPRYLLRIRRDSTNRMNSISDGASWQNFVLIHAYSGPTTSFREFSIPPAIPRTIHWSEPLGGCEAP